MKKTIEFEGETYIKVNYVKELLDKKFKEKVEERKKAHRRYTLEGYFNRLKDNLFFLIDNSDYVRKTGNPSGSLLMGGVVNA